MVQQTRRQPERLTVNLTGRSLDALANLMLTDESTKTEAVNRAI